MTSHSNPDAPWLKRKIRQWLTPTSGPYTHSRFNSRIYRITTALCVAVCAPAPYLFLTGREKEGYVMTGVACILTLWLCYAYQRIRYKGTWQRL